jgi:hypothetical protein
VSIYCQSKSSDERAGEILHMRGREGFSACGIGGMEVREDLACVPPTEDCIAQMMCARRACRRRFNDAVAKVGGAE